MAKTGKNGTKVVWAIDAQRCTTKMAESIGEAVRDFFGEQRAVVEPVYILTPDVSALPITWFDEVLPKLRGEAMERLAMCTRHLRTTELERTRILVSRQQGSQRAAQRLIRYATKAEADMIVVATRGRSGLPRFFMGSFAESLLLHSHLSVLAVGPKFKPRSRSKGGTILCPTDLSSESQRVFGVICRHARESASKLVVFHSLPSPLRGPPSPGPSLVPSLGLVSSHLTKEQERRRLLTNELSRRAKALGIDATPLIDLSEAHVPDAILLAAETRKATLIAMTSRSGPLRAAFAGSVTRQVVRAAQCPVWVLASRSKKK